MLLIITIYTYCHRYNNTYIIYLNKIILFAIKKKNDRSIDVREAYMIIKRFTLHCVDIFVNKKRILTSAGGAIFKKITIEKNLIPVYIRVF